MACNPQHMLIDGHTPGAFQQQLERLKNLRVKAAKRQNFAGLFPDPCIQFFAQFRRPLRMFRPHELALKKRTNLILFQSQLFDFQSFFKTF